MEAVRRHRYVVNCRTVLGTRCAVCHGAGVDDAKTTPSSHAPPDSLCPGVAIVHADLSLECSVPDCETNPSRDGWLARHGDVRSCNDVHDGCPLCSIPDDHR
jgi:hypothetical protein